MGGDEEGDDDDDEDGDADAKGWLLRRTDSGSEYGGRREIDVRCVWGRHDRMADTSAWMEVVMND